MAQRVGEAEVGPKPTLSDTVDKAWRDVREAKAKLDKRPSYYQAVAVQILTRHHNELRKLSLVR